MTSMKTKIHDLEKQLVDMRFACNSKINGEEVRDIIDKKFMVLNDYRRDADNINKRYSEITSQIRSGIENQQRQISTVGS